MTDDDQKMLGRVRALLAASVAGVDPLDHAARIAWCEEHEQHGVRAQFDGELIVFTWGGRPLAMIQRDVLLEDVPIRGEFIPDLPDSLPDEWSDQ
jgi:hypothetical protein